MTPPIEHPQHPHRALVLGGGGVVGRAWQMGLAAGILDHGIDLSEADLIIGTSAGAVTGAQLALGVDPRGPSLRPTRSTPMCPTPWQVCGVWRPRSPTL
jgi:NTE family protein